MPVEEHHSREPTQSAESLKNCICNYQTKCQWALLHSNNSIIRPLRAVIGPKGFTHPIAPSKWEANLLAAAAAAAAASSHKSTASKSGRVTKSRLIFEVQHKPFLAVKPKESLSDLIFSCRLHHHHPLPQSQIWAGVRVGERVRENEQKDLLLSPPRLHRGPRPPLRLLRHLLRPHAPPPWRRTCLRQHRRRLLQWSGNLSRRLSLPQIFPCKNMIN